MPLLPPVRRFYVVLFVVAENWCGAAPCRAAALRGHQQPPEGHRRAAGGAGGGGDPPRVSGRRLGSSHAGHDAGLPAVCSALLPLALVFGRACFLLIVCLFCPLFQCCAARELCFPASAPLCVQAWRGAGGAEPHPERQVAQHRGQAAAAPVLGPHAVRCGGGAGDTCALRCMHASWLPAGLHACPAFVLVLSRLPPPLAPPAPVLPCPAATRSWGGSGWPRATHQRPAQRCRCCC